MSAALILGEIAKLSLQAYLLSAELRGLSKEETLKEIEVEYEGFKQRHVEDIPKPG